MSRKGRTADSTHPACPQPFMPCPCMSWRLPQAQAHAPGQPAQRQRRPTLPTPGTPYSATHFERAGPQPHLHHSTTHMHANAHHLRNTTTIPAILQPPPPPRPLTPPPHPPRRPPLLCSPSKRPPPSPSARAPTLMSESSAASHFAASRCSCARSRASGEHTSSSARAAALKARFTCRRSSGCSSSRPDAGWRCAFVCVARLGLGRVHASQGTQEHEGGRRGGQYKQSFQLLLSTTLVGRRWFHE